MDGDECCLPRHQVALNMFFSQITLLDLIGMVCVASKAGESLKLRLENLQSAWAQDRFPRHFLRWLPCEAVLRYWHHGTGFVCMRQHIQKGRRGSLRLFCWITLAVMVTVTSNRSCFFHQDCSAFFSACAACTMVWSQVGCSCWFSSLELMFENHGPGGMQLQQTCSSVQLPSRSIRTT